MRTIKCVVIGDPGVGKTSLLLTYNTKKFPGEKSPKTYDSYSSSVLVDGQPITLNLWDTAGQDEFDELRKLSYPQTDVFLICFSLNDPESLTRVRTKWNVEIGQYAGEDTPIILVGTKLDLRQAEEKSVQPVGDAAKVAGRRRTTSIVHVDGLNMAKEVDAVKYVECSALTQKNVATVFDEAVRAVIHPLCSKHKERNCKRCEKEPSKNYCSVQ